MRIPIMIPTYPKVVLPENSSTTRIPTVTKSPIMTRNESLPKCLLCLGLDVLLEFKSGYDWTSFKNPKTTRISNRQH